MLTYQEAREFVEEAKSRGWKPCKRTAKNRYLYLLPQSKAEKRKLIKMCKYQLITP